MSSMLHVLKNLSHRCVLACLLSLAAVAQGAVTFTVSPSTVSNTYSGLITLQINGLTNGETVVVQKFIDLNTNSAIDGTDWLVQQFQLTDGQAGMTIGGIVNSNVPGDVNPAASNITAQLNFQSGDFAQNFVGKYFYKLSSPVSRFTPVTNLFTVTNLPYAQKITGNVVSNNTATTLPNAVIMLFPPPRPGQGGPSGPPVAGAVANNSGSYTIPAPVGTYMAVAFKSNFLANFASPLVLTLASGATVTTNLTLTNTTASISGTLVDAGNSSIKLAGILTTASSTNGLMGIIFTDTNGAFSVRVQAGTWGVRADDLSLIVRGYVGLQNETNLSAGTSGKILGYPKATALFYGSVTDNLGNPLPGIDLYASDTGVNVYETDGYTDANGNYFAAVLGGLGSNDPWRLDLSSDSAPTNYVFSQPSSLQEGPTNLSTGTVVRADFAALLATNHITGSVKANGTNIAGVGVFAYASINGTNYNASADTGPTGNYWLNVPNGYWTVSVNCNGGDDSLDNILGFGTYACPNNQAVTINNNNATNNFTVQPCGTVGIGTSSLPPGEVNVYYDQFLQASSCYGPLNWTVISGSLPSGLTLGSNGELYGTPGGSGTNTFTVRVTDGHSQTASQTLSLTIYSAVQITTTTLPSSTNGAIYSQQLQATGGQLPYSWSLSPGPGLPPNLNLSSSGLLSGTLAASGTFDFSVQVMDNFTATAEQPLSLTVNNTNPPPLFVGMGGSRVMVSWPASAGTNYTLEMTTNLATGPWVPATTGVPSIGLTFTNQSPATFFRLR